MKPQKQKFSHDPDNGVYGDCYRTCVAAILDIDRDQVPHVGDPGEECIPPLTGDSMVERMNSWLKQFGLAAACFAFPGSVTAADMMAQVKGQNPGMPFILIGESSRGPEIGHAVVVQDGKIVCNPNDSQVVGPIDGYWWLECICVIDRERVSKIKTRAWSRELTGDMVAG